MNTIGASNINDARYADSNYGSVVKLFAPGECVYAPTIGGTGQTVYVNGTSFASPYVRRLPVKAEDAMFANDWAPRSPA